MAILEASGKQEPEAKEAPAGPLEEVRVPQPGTMSFWEAPAEREVGGGQLPVLCARPSSEQPGP